MCIRDSQCVVPDNLRLESAGITLPPITIFWIQGHVLLVVRRTHPIGVTHHDLLVESFECPSIGNQIMGEIIEEMRMSGLTSLETKVINGFHDAPPKMMMPEPVNNDPRKEVSCTVVHISDPLSYSASFHRCPGSGGLVDGPVVSSLPVTRENFEEVQWGDAAFLGRISADEVITLRVEIRYFPAVGMMPHGLETFSTDHDLLPFSPGPG